MLLSDNVVRRTDLDLRCYSIGLETTIYQINRHHHIIHCVNYTGDFSALQTYFNESIRPLGYLIELAEEVPQEYESVLSPIPFSNVVDGFKGAYITRPEIEAAITGRFPDVEILNLKITTSPGFSVVVEVAPETPVAQMVEMEHVLRDIDLGTDQVKVRCGERKSPRAKESDTPYEGFFKNSHLEINKKLLFTLDETEFWHAYATDIYTGVRRRGDIPKFYPNSTSCFIDYSFSDQVDLRNVLLLYDVVYLVLPTADRFDAFLASQKMGKADLLTLTEMGKVVIVLLGAEENYDVQFLMDAYNGNALSVLGRRGINCIVAALLCETKEKFLSHFPQALETAAELSAYARKKEDAGLLSLAHFLAWPIAGTANSFRILNVSGPGVYGSFGLDNAMVSAYGCVNTNREESFRFLLNLAAQKTFVASALNATAFPSYPEGENPLPPLSRFVSDLLQLYWYDATALSRIQTARERALQPRQALSLFCCKENISVTKVAMLAEKHHTSDGFKGILTDLGQLDETECFAKIRMYNDLLFDLANTTPSTSKLDMLLSATSFFSLPAEVNAPLTILSGIKSIVCHTQAAQESAELKQIETCMKNAGLQPDRQTAEEVHLLHKISPVVSLR